MEAGIHFPMMQTKKTSVIASETKQSPVDLSSLLFLLTSPPARFDLAQHRPLRQERGVTDAKAVIMIGQCLIRRVRPERKNGPAKGGIAGRPRPKAISGRSGNEALGRAWKEGRCCEAAERPTLSSFVLLVTQNQSRTKPYRIISTTTPNAPFLVLCPIK
jgi:hypothetical protein